MEIGEINSKKENGSVPWAHLPQSSCSLLLKGSKKVLSPVLSTRSANTSCQTVIRKHFHSYSLKSKANDMSGPDMSGPATAECQLYLLSQSCQDIDQDKQDLTWNSTDAKSQTQHGYCARLEPGTSSSLSTATGAKWVKGQGPGARCNQTKLLFD
ncbi:unnamed protein product [Nyctereutes procyonoides]|uniref:(raccoon dog) hypothetical protein n=1 Tax=Nyctereutes procyonoides TaxID=34880 RepID=A0A811YTS0_NYCPR|nr:unnamed protein product [Nyctereutes procyonoides]